ncbi:MAG: hypothetical protein GEV12_14360 [Micromonosporaceae bacterium]|nr:hypothetical protein [Micromonosporaceae bacterium]
MAAAKHDWHTFDAERGLTVRQATNRLRANRWEVRRAGRTVELDDVAFDRLRSDPVWLPQGLA